MIEAAIFNYGGTLANPRTGLLYPGARETLDELTQRNIPLGLITMPIDPRQRRKDLLQRGIAPFFNGLILLRPINLAID
jgi:phosphoglycolate phosphatase-like HAD superfamily hydrolase